MIIDVIAYAIDGDRERCLESGMDDYMPEPLRIKDLAIALKNV
jgi:CheY-like chemotaxis protein